MSTAQPPTSSLPPTADELTQILAGSELTATLDPGDRARTDARASFYPTLDLTQEPVDFALFQALTLDRMFKHHFVPV